jgi:hypothetical protein
VTLLGLVLTTAGLPWLLGELRQLREQGEQPVRAKPEAAVPVEPGPAPPSLRVRKISVQHFSRINQVDAAARGALGRQSFSARRLDQLMVEAELNRPAHAFVIALRPDGEAELCFPEDENASPPLTDRPRFPTHPQKRHLRYCLEAGTGLWAFAVVASEAPLPGYRTWLADRPAPPWQPIQTAQTGTVWFDDGRWLEVLRAGGPQCLDRCKEESDLSPAGAVVRLTNWLRAPQSGQAAATLGFVVEP